MYVVCACVWPPLSSVLVILSIINFMISEFRYNHHLTISYLNYYKTIIYHAKTIIAITEPNMTDVWCDHACESAVARSRLLPKFKRIKNRIWLKTSLQFTVLTALVKTSPARYSAKKGSWLQQWSLPHPPLPYVTPCNLPQTWPIETRPLVMKRGL